MKKMTKKVPLNNRPKHMISYIKLQHKKTMVIKVTLTLRNSRGEQVSLSF